MFVIILPLVLAGFLYADTDQSIPQVSNAEQDIHTTQEAAVYQNSWNGNNGFLIMVVKGNGYQLNGVYQLKDKARTHQWHANCTPKTDVTFDCRYTHDMGYTESGSFSLSFQNNGDLNLEIQGSDGHKSNPIYSRVLPK